MSSVLGLSSGYHDSAAALTRDGNLAAIAAEERFSRIKHDASFPAMASRFCLDFAGIEAQSLDRIVYYEQPWVKFTRVLLSTLDEYPRGMRVFARSMRDWLSNKLWVHDDISKRLDVHPDRIAFVDHHASHAAMAFLASPWEKAAVLTIDAVGEWSTTSIAVGDRTADVPVRQLETVPYPHSIGLVYSAFTAFLGFAPNDGECSTMALAAFGEPRYLREVEHVLRPLAGGLYEVDPGYFRFLASDGSVFTRKFTGLFGPPRDPASPYPFRCDAPAGEGVPAEVQRYADIAASLQHVVERIVLGLAARARRLTGLDRICIGGGVAMNAVAIGKLIESGLFEAVSVPPDPGDSGGAAGAALLHSPRPAVPASVTPYLGAAVQDCGQAAGIARSLPLDETRGHQLPGCARRTGSVREERPGSRDALAEQAAAHLRAGRLVAVVQDRFELGPRALGNRSILCDPANGEAAARLSRLVKSRAAFRPYALVVHEDAWPRFFGWSGDVPPPARWMQCVAPVDPGMAGAVRFGLHVDGTTRPQICGEAQNPLLSAILRHFGGVSGVPALINTSLNEAGYPMAASALDALLIFFRTDLDVLLLQDRLIVKPQ